MRRPLVTTVLVLALTGITAVAAHGKPRVLFTDLTSGPVRGGVANLGAPITIYGSGFGSRRSTSTVTIGGQPVAKYLSWRRGTLARAGLDRIVVLPGRRVRSGPIVVTVAGRSARGPRFDVTSGRVFGVARSGSDSAPCSLSRPCGTISHVVGDVMRPGDVLLVRGGTYDEGEVWIRGDQGDSGLAGRQVTIAAFPGERVVLDNASRPFIVDADHVTVAGLEFRNGKSLGIPDTGLPGHRGNRFIANRFRGTIGFSAVDVHGDAHLIAGNDCQVSGSTVGTQGHCFYVSYGTDVAIRFNVGSGAPGYGLHVFDQQRSSNGDFRRVISRLTIEGNVLRGSTERSGAILAMGDEGGLGNRISDVTIRGNTFTRNNHTGLVIGQGASDIRVSGNRFVQNGRQGLTTVERATGVTITGNRFVQSANGVCRSNCDWYPLAHIGLGTGSLVTIRGNRYGPGPPVIVGGRDAAPAALSRR